MLRALHAFDAFDALQLGRHWIEPLHLRQERRLGLGGFIENDFMHNPKI